MPWTLSRMPGRRSRSNDEMSKLGFSIIDVAAVLVNTASLTSGGVIAKTSSDSRSSAPGFSQAMVPYLAGWDDIAGFPFLVEPRLRGLNERAWTNLGERSERDATSG